MTMKSLILVEWWKWNRLSQWIWTILFFLMGLAPLSLFFNVLDPSFAIHYLFGSEFGNLVGFLVALLLILGYGVEYQYDAFPLLLSQGLRRDDFLKGKVIFSLLFACAFYLSLVVSIFLLNHKEMRAVSFHWKGVLLSFLYHMGLLLYFILYSLAILFLFKDRGIALFFFLGYNLVGEQLLGFALTRWISSPFDTIQWKQLLPYGILDALGQISQFEKEAPYLYIALVFYLTLYVLILYFRIYPIPKK